MVKSDPLANDQPRAQECPKSSVHNLVNSSFRAKGYKNMRGKGLLVVVALAVLTTISFGLNYGSRIARAGAAVNLPALVDEVNLQPVTEENGFTVDVLAGGQTLREYAGPGRGYVEALENAEYELIMHNRLGSP